MKLSLYPYQLQFKYPFRIAHGIRTETAVVYVKLEHREYVGWGEAALPPYLAETQQTVIEFLETFAEELSSSSPDVWFEKLSAEQTNLSAKAALDMALWSLKAQVEEKTIGELLDVPQSKGTPGTYTIGVSSPDEMKTKIEEANSYGFEIFKLKLNGKNDDTTIENFRSVCNKPFAVDVNQGWRSVEEASGKIIWLKKQGCLFIEQPLPKDAWKEMKQLKKVAALPLYADESCQRLTDLEKMTECFDGVNIKLMKCGGITEGHQMVLQARKLGLKVLIGCMSESSVGCTAASHLTPLADYADLDGPYLITNDPFEGMKIKNGKVDIQPLKKKDANLL